MSGVIELLSTTIVSVYRRQTSNRAGLVAFLRGWDKKTSWQTSKCLEDLDLAEIIPDLKKYGLL